MLEAKLPPDAVVDPVPPRFGWPMRIFLSLLLFDIIFRSMAVLLPRERWYKELEVESYPWRLPTHAEMAKLARGANTSHPNPVFERVMDSADSIWDFFKPWPGEKSRPKVVSWAQGGKYALCWLDSRCEFLENVLGINEEWPMFSPNVSRRAGMARSLLFYVDGSRRTVRLLADPEDLTCYSHWFQEKVLDYELKVDCDADLRQGYCNFLAHRHASNENGSPLVRIQIFRVTYYYPPPEKDPLEYLRTQTGPPLDQIMLPFYEYDVATGQGNDLEDWTEALAGVSCLPTQGFPVGVAPGALLHGIAAKILLQLDR